MYLEGRLVYKLKLRHLVSSRMFPVSCIILLQSMSMEEIVGYIWLQSHEWPLGLTASLIFSSYNTSSPTLDKTFCLLAHSDIELFDSEARRASDVFTDTHVKYCFY